MSVVSCLLSIKRPRRSPRWRVRGPRAPGLSRRSRECVHKVDNSPEGQSSENNASGRRRDRTSSSLPSWAVCGPMMDRARGARGPLTLRLAGTPGRWIERNNNLKQPKSYPVYWWLPTDRPNLRLGSRKGAYLPPQIMGSVSFSMFDSR